MDNSINKKNSILQTTETVLFLTRVFTICPIALGVKDNLYQSWALKLQLLAPEAGAQQFYLL